jgi:cobalt/nickel transport protein
MMKRNLLMLLGVILLAALPLMIHRDGGSGFSGADAQATAQVAEIQPEYQPWFTPVWKPPSGEIESLLFALQATLGAGLVGFYFGRRSAVAQEPSQGQDRS